MQKMLEDIVHKQDQTPIQTDNITAEVLINKKVQPKLNKTMDMRFHWLRYRESQEQFSFSWRPGTRNREGYWTKQHAPTHHKNM